METLKRLLMALLLLPLVIFSVFNTSFSGIFYIILLSIASSIGVYEFYRIFQNKNIRLNLFLLIFFVIAAWAGEYILNFYPLETINIKLWLLIILFLILGIIEIFKKDFSKSLETIAGSLLIFVYLGVLFTFSYKIKMISPNGPYIFFYLVSLTWLCDSFAYFSGKYLGKHKLNLPVSPNKTLEGFIGGLLLSVGYAFLIRYILKSQLTITVFKLKYFIPVTILIIIFTFLGDMIESVFKRSAKVKDSLKIIPGHGGILDILDSLIITSTLFYFIMFFTI